MRELSGRGANVLEKITNGELRGKHSALQILGNRFLPTIGSDLKIGECLRIVAKRAEIVSAVRNKIAPRLMEEEGLKPADFDKMSNMAQQMFVARLNEAYSEFDSREVEIEIPDRLLVKQADLPKEKTGDDGWKNGSSIGAIVADLGDTFEYPKTENEGKKE